MSVSLDVRAIGDHVPTVHDVQSLVLSGEGKVVLYAGLGATIDVCNITGNITVTVEIGSKEKT